MSADTLVFCPTFTIDGKPQIHPDCLRSIEALQGDHHFQIGLYNPTNEKHINIFTQYKTARELTLADGYEYLMTVEHDMIVPPDALIKLREAGAPVAYGLYMLRHNSNRLNAWRRIPKHITLAEDFATFPGDLDRARKAKIVEVAGVGFGCTLFRKDALIAAPFRPGSPRSQVPDVRFAEDCLIKGILQVCRFDVICGHIEPDGNVLWPFSNEGKFNMTQVNILQTINATVDKQTIHLIEGTTVELPNGVAHELERAGYVRISDRIPAGPREHHDKPVKRVVPPIRKEPLEKRR